MTPSSPLGPAASPVPLHPAAALQAVGRGLELWYSNPGPNSPESQRPWVLTELTRNTMVSLGPKQSLSYQSAVNICA
jgi:hypothetical protein